MEKPADFYLQLTTALLNSSQDINLNSRAIHLNQIFEESLALFLDHRSCTYQAQHKVGEPSQWRCWLCNLDEILERESRANPKSDFGMQGMGQTHQLGNAGFGQPCQKSSWLTYICLWKKLLKPRTHQQCDAEDRRGRVDVTVLVALTDRMRRSRRKRKLRTLKALCRSQASIELADLYKRCSRFILR